MNKIRAYLYTHPDDHTINVHEGYVEVLWLRQGLFTADNGARYYVSNEPGTLHYRKLWMTNRNDELAKRLYIEYHEHKVKEIERTLDMHKQAIITLKGEK